ncbi:integrase, catalytic region, zinc finger, CCHC-type containing protein [Tanacetum coccineum]
MVSLPHATIDITNVHSFQPQSRWISDETELFHRTSSLEMQRCQFKQDDSLPQILKYVCSRSRLSIVEPKNFRRQNGWILHGSIAMQCSLRSIRIFVDHAAHKLFSNLSSIHGRENGFLNGPLEGGKVFVAQPEGDSGFELTAFSDADHAGCLDTRKSTSGGIQFLGDKLVSWMSKKQNCTAMSSAEA